MYKKILIIAMFAAGKFGNCQSFIEMQLRFDRVNNAMKSSDNSMREAFAEANIAYPPKYIYWRAFKTEKELELWAGDDPYKPHKLIKTYQVCRLSGTLGFKHHEGDEQIPEGLYFINHYNPFSSYHLSFRVSYPNGVDSFWGDRKSLGGQIYIHGQCETIGCLPMTDSIMQEIYWISIQAQSWQGFGAKVPIHIFPYRPINEKIALNSNYWLIEAQKYSPRWKNLFYAHEHFERKHFPGRAYHNGNGYYLLDTIAPKITKKLPPIYWNPVIKYPLKSDTPLEMMRLARYLKPIKQINYSYVVALNKLAIETGINYRLESKYVEILPDPGEFRPFNAPKRYKKIIDTVYVELNPKKL